MPRPREMARQEQKKVSLVILKKHHRFLDARAKKQGRSKSAVLRALLDDAMRRAKPEKHAS